jgi:hypothetical protein
MLGVVLVLDGGCRGAMAVLPPSREIGEV